MSRLINAGFVTYAAEREFSEEDAAKVRWLISHIPSSDAVQVVRCKDCRCSEPTPLGEEYVYCNHTCMVVFGRDYCSYGEPEMKGCMM